MVELALGETTTGRMHDWRMTSHRDTSRIAPVTAGVHGRPRCSACTLSLRCASSACRGHAPSTLLGHFVHAPGSNDEFFRL